MSRSRVDARRVQRVGFADPGPHSDSDANTDPNTLAHPDTGASFDRLSVDLDYRVRDRQRQHELLF